MIVVGTAAQAATHHRRQRDPHPRCRVSVVGVHCESAAEIYPGELGEGDPGDDYFTYGVIDLEQGLVVRIRSRMAGVCDPLS